MNPDELLNSDTKTSSPGCLRPLNVHELMASVRAYLRITPRSSRLVERYFRERHVQYAAH